MNVRPAIPEDVPLVLPMVAKIAAYHENLDPAKYGYRDHPEELYRHWLTPRATDPRSVFLVADATTAGEEKKLAGFLVGTVEKEIPIYRLSEFGFVHDVWVDEDYRNEGLARQMVTLAIERFGAIGVKQIRLDVVFHNGPAHGLFAACGFRESIFEMLLELPAGPSRSTIHP
ncbi:MAG TPA: GNAT family N-acetyltransferase [Tepidisphaeraceae bacterium]|jgi:ribosomal protein S18 acetylase RimI-like enzyme|nr:GNAT family N-acetyltransferase [Tepidisphaeraceae bacterium]